MTVDLEAIARRGRCEVSSLQIALPLLQQGYLPPFLARYRRDELGGVDEASLWLLAAAINDEKAIADRRDELIALWQATPLADPAIGQAIRNANSMRILDRVARRLKLESSDRIDPSLRLAVRVLNPRKGDSGNLDSLAANADSIDDAANAVAGLDEALPKRLAGDPRLINAAARWLAKHARIHIVSVDDPHLADDHAPSHQESDDQAIATAPDAAKSIEPNAVTAAEEIALAADVPDSASTISALASDAVQPTLGETIETLEAPADAPADAPDAEPTATDAVSVEAAGGEPTSHAAAAETAASEATGADTPDAEPASASSEPSTSTAEQTTKASSARKAAPKVAKKPKKKISPRQRRRRWLVSVLKPLAGKRISANKLSSFQVVMLGRALRSQVAQCAFEYDATKLVAELQRTVAGFNRHLSEELSSIVLEHEANIREAAESAWWDELHERASSRLVGIAAVHLRRHVDRGNVDAKVVMSIDAVGPRTAATAIVASDGRLLHSDDLPCQLSQALRSQTVARMGELIHTYHVDLIVISNGPSRRACMVATADLIAQSPEKSIRWTLADRSGADVYAASSVADQEMRGTPRRFRAAAWLAFSVLQPAQAFAKVDPLKLRLASFQRELSEEALGGALESITVSGASRGGVDVNSAPLTWLERLPGVTTLVAEAIDSSRRQSLFTSREAIAELETWNSVIESRQALPFLRVFGSDEVLDGTLIHPEDYALAKKLASVLGIELPPAAPPGYQPPNYLPEESVEGEQSTKTEELEPSRPEPDASSDETSDEPAATAGDAGETTAETASQTDTAVVDADEAPAESVADRADEGFGPVTEPSGESSGSSLATAPTATENETSNAESELNAAAPSLPPEPVRRARPEQSKIDKCTKEWQVGSRRVNQLVHWLCDPFGDGEGSGRPPAVLTSMPSIKHLKQGDQVIGVVVGVMPFGVFVELAPDCSGLIHVSKVSDAFVEDVHEVLQVGDVVTAWVTGIDDKRRRVALSAVSPEREAELREMKQDRDAHSGRGSFRGGQGRGGQGRGGEQAGRGQTRGGQARGSEQRVGDTRGKSAGPPRGGPRRDSRGDSRGGRPRDARGGRGREKQPESYRVVSSEPAAPISDAMKKGVEPLRSFGDLMQFYTKKDQPVTEPTPAESSSDSAAENPPTEAAVRNAAQDVTAESTPHAVPHDPPSSSETLAGDGIENDEPSTTEASADSASAADSSGSTQAAGENGGGADKPCDQSAPTDASTS